MPPGDFVLEIGTGLGALTRALGARAKKVVSVEIDRGLLALHKETLAGLTNVTVLEGDILKYDLKGLCAEHFGGGPFHVCGNLPYYITSRILMQVLESGAPVRSLTAMVQKEVAGAPLRAAGRHRLRCAHRVLPVFLRSPRRYSPYRAAASTPPRCGFAIIRMELSHPTCDVPRDGYTAVVRAAFSMRRKTICNNLKALAGEDAKSILKSCKIDPNARAQELTASQFCEIAKSIFQNCK